MKKVLIIEDNEDITRILIKKLKTAPYLVSALDNGAGVISYLSKSGEHPDALILDLMLPDRSGIELLGAIKSMLPSTQVFIFSAYQQYTSMIPKDYVEGFFLKTDGIDHLMNALNHSLTVQ